MTNWIDDAKKQAEAAKRQKERAASERIGNLNVERERKIIRFRQATYYTKTRIERILANATKQGLKIQNFWEGDTEGGVGDCMRKSWSSGNEYGNDYEWGQTVYCYVCSITEPITGNRLSITLGTLSSNWFFGESLTPVLILSSGLLNHQKIQVSELEAQIKAWLVQIFSEQK